MNIIISNPFSTDIITNSSSVVYSMATSVDSLHDFIDEILKYFGTDKKSRDVFDIMILPDLERLRWGGIDSLDDEVASRFSDLEKLEWSREVGDLYVQRGIQLVKEGVLHADDFVNTDGFYNSSYLVSLKDGSETKLGNMVEHLFSHEGSYDG